LVGHHHSGIDDCYNILSIVKEMGSQGYKFLSYQEKKIDGRFIREDDWICVYCTTHNFSLTSPCRQCTRAMDATSIRAIPRGIIPKPGDWSCPHCTVLNFRNRMQCFGCGESRPDNIPVVEEIVRPTYFADWNCSNCGFLNFSYRTQCRQCMTAKDT